MLLCIYRVRDLAASIANFAHSIRNNKRIALLLLMLIFASMVSGTHIGIELALHPHVSRFHFDAIFFPQIVTFLAFL